MRESDTPSLVTSMADGSRPRVAAVGLAPRPELAQAKDQAAAEYSPHIPIMTRDGIRAFERLARNLLKQ